MRVVAVDFRPATPLASNPLPEAFDVPCLLAEAALLPVIALEEAFLTLTCLAVRVTPALVAAFFTGVLLPDARRALEASDASDTDARPCFGRKAALPLAALERPFALAKLFFTLAPFRAGLCFVEAGLCFVEAGLCFVEAGLCFVEAGLCFVEAGLCFVEAGLRFLEAEFCFLEVATLTASSSGL